MAVSIYRRNAQADGEFNGGEILEKKPIGFPQDRGKLKPYGNLFYWAHAWTDMGSTIGHHPHKGFEIISFVIKGEIEHFDNKTNQWNRLSEGDLQLMQAGNGIVHAEKMLPGSHMFQIWFDPNLEHTLGMPAAYKDLRKGDFTFSTNGKVKTKTYAGGQSGLQLIAEGVDVQDVYMDGGDQVLSIPPGKFFSVYLLEGTIDLGEQTLVAEDFFLVTKQESVKLKSNGTSRLFVIACPERPSYQTYAELYL